ncbi:MAG TPA: hypothetical protein VK797_23315 [Tepidisphaeraceae bacterium]|jgi:hypothetical protein|nr:hypothetical protein [Tepidisphaeraceae bacterium]
MSLNASQLASDALAAMQKVLAAQWPSILALATSQAQKLALTLVDIEQMVQAKQIDSDTAADLLDSQRRATTAVLLCIRGMDQIVVEQAINAALAVVASAVNTAIGFPLL